MMEASGGKEAWHNITRQLAFSTPEKVFFVQHAYMYAGTTSFWLWLLNKKTQFYILSM